MRVTDISAYEQLRSHFNKMSALGGASAILSWDNAVVMPDGGAESRADTMAVLGVISHEMMTDPKVKDLLDQAESNSATLSASDQANLREMKRGWQHANALPVDLVEAFSRATSECEMIWREARLNDDFEALQPSLTKVVDLVREIAEVKSDVLGLAPYDALLDEYEPDCRSSQIDPLFDDLADFLPSFLEEVLEYQKEHGNFKRPEGPFDLEIQKTLGIELMKDLGFNFDRGRLDTSHHPFTGGIPDDVRLTTRYEEDDFTQSLMGTLHETGHALYEQNLPKEWRGQPAGDARGMALHESQSLLVEMQLSRGEAFLRYLQPKLKSAFSAIGEEWEFENLKNLYHHVEKGFIRVDADEVTYPLHVILRYRLEKAMLSGDLQVKDLPSAWNEGMEELLGVRPENDRLGCLQDIHWPGGAIGYFPTYTLGALAAAQIYQAADTHISGLDNNVAAGEFKPLVQWLSENIHQKGSLKSADEILLEATGSALGVDAFKQHLKSRYLPR
ncbi:carboxypeptidase M32 [Sneathiella sp. P13V-1]|uniref:carboxypeptidase M32 n=1 Tax=Sneathiella sp. P13V-1 TaxID=2697366 RepID=UPI001D122D15